MKHNKRLIERHVGAPSEYARAQRPGTGNVASQAHCEASGDVVVHPIQRRVQMCQQRCRPLVGSRIRGDAGGIECLDERVVEYSTFVDVQHARRATWSCSRAQEQLQPAQHDRDAVR